MNEVKVFFFATFRDRVGSKEATMQLEEGMTVGEFRDALPVHFPNLDGALDAALVAINKQHV